MKRVKKFKHLRTSVDENLTWNEHYKMLTCKVKAALSSLYKPKIILKPSLFDQLYKVQFESHLKYSDKLWEMLRLQHHQRLKGRANIIVESSRLKDWWGCNWFSVSILMQFEKAATIYKIVTNSKGN